MRVLLMAMPDVASAFDRVMRIPNLGIVSLAANVGDAEVRVLDLVLHSRRVGAAVEEALSSFRPDLVGLSAMTFQYDTAKQVAALVRRARPAARTVLGGYHATLAYQQIADDSEADVFDFLVRGEGELALNLLVQALAAGHGWETVPGLSYRGPAGFVHNPRGPLLEVAQLRPPARHARINHGFHYFDKPFDVVETSRGCLRACRFCSIRRMYGAGYRAYPVERVVTDIEAAADAGAEGVFFADDNINLEPERLRGICEAIIEAGLDTLEYITQADVTGFAKMPELAPLMYRAGFRGVFLGIESVAQQNWRFLRKSNAETTTHDVVQNLRSHGIAVAGGFILASPDDDAAAIRATFRMARRLHVDHAIMWCLTPYPGTEVREELLAEGLVTNPDDFRTYNGYICNVRTRHLTHPQLVRLIASEGLKLYFDPRFLFQGRVWGRRPGSLIPYFATVSEYLTRAYHNRLFASRHRM